MLAIISKAFITTIATTAVLEYITRPRAVGSALEAGQSAGGYVRNIPTAIKNTFVAAYDYAHGVIDGLANDEATLAARKHADAHYAKEEAAKKEFAEHA